MILTEETGHKWGDIEILKPEPVEIMGEGNMHVAKLLLIIAGLGSDPARAQHTATDEGTDVDETPANRAPAISSGPTSASVPENTTSVGAYTVTDADGDTMCVPLTQPGHTQDAPADSLAVVEMRRFDIENDGLRNLAKLGVGTLSGVLVTGVVTKSVLPRIYPPKDPDDTFRELGLFLLGVGVGCSVGFPLGVTAVDPYDSFPKTLLAGVIPGLVGLGLLLEAAVDDDLAGTGFLLMYVVPPISSLAVSEASRKPPQPSRISLGLAPTTNGSLSAVAQLCF